MQGVLDFREAGVGPGGRGVDVSRRFHGQRLVRSLRIEFLHKIIEAGLLGQAVLARGTGRFFFQGEVHTLMAAILLGMPRLDPLDRDAES